MTTPPIARAIILTDAGAYPYDPTKTAYTPPTGTPTPSPSPGQLDFSNPANSGLL